MAINWVAERDRNENTYAGYVLEKRHDPSYRIMSDVWCPADFALVWDADNKCPRLVLVNVYDMQPKGWVPVSIEVDATADVQEAYLEHRTELMYNSLLQDEIDRVERVEKGCIAKVVKGKTGKGTVGKVVVSMDGSYGMGWRARQMKKYAIATSDVQIDKPLRNGKVMKVYRDVVWVWGCNVKRVDIAPIDKEAIRKLASERVLREYVA